MRTLSRAILNGRIYFGCWDCNLYCIDMEGGLVWKFHTSLSYPAPINIEPGEAEKSVEVVWKLGEDIGKEKRDDEIAISDYGEFSGAYIDTTKTDYLGVKKRGYVK